MAKTLYDLLGLPRNATPDAIKDAYVKQAARLRSSGATAQADVLKQAYDVLSDPRLRARYDQQAYKVADDAPALGDESGRRWLFSWRGALLSALVLGVGFYSWSHYRTEQLRVRLEHERLEAKRAADDLQRENEARRLEAEQNLALQRRQEAINAAAAQGANQMSRAETLYRESLQHQRDMQNDRLQLQRDRDAARREELERRRIDLQNARELARDRRQAQELERASPRRY